MCLSVSQQGCMVTKMLLGCLVSLLFILNRAVDSRTLHTDSCSFNVYTHELRKYYADMRHHAISGDTETGVKILDKSLMKDVQEDQTCCFLRLLLRFYVERVFNNFSPSEPHQLRCSSAVANAFVSIRRDMQKCHCHCAEETHRQIDSMHTAFDELQIQLAAQKAVGELDTVLDWLEALGHKA
uniref:Interleukin family protein n=1 Tax=Oryzias latipes TaxID=8090 RepID=A0A3P9J795_ORYLA